MFSFSSEQRDEAGQGERAQVDMADDAVFHDCIGSIFKFSCCMVSLVFSVILSGKSAFEDKIPSPNGHLYYYPTKTV